MLCLFILMLSVFNLMLGAFMLMLTVRAPKSMHHSRTPENQTIRKPQAGRQKTRQPKTQTRENRKTRFSDRVPCPPGRAWPLGPRAGSPAGETLANCSKTKQPENPKPGARKPDNRKAKPQKTGKPCFPTASRASVPRARRSGCAPAATRSSTRGRRSGCAARRRRRTTR